MGGILFALIQSSFVIIAFSTFTTFAIDPTTKPHKKSLVFKLIHTDSIFSPYHNPKESIEDRAKQLLDSSKARLAYMQNKFFGATSKSNDDDPEFKLIPWMSHGGTYGFGFLANISIGEPPIPQLLVIDTGSSLTWVPCATCNGCSKGKLGPVYDIRSSSTYLPLPCQDATSCGPFFSDNPTCDALNLCNFHISYQDGTHLEGELGTEKLSYETIVNGTYALEGAVPDIIFGCPSNASTPIPRGLDVGILGLGSKTVSILHKVSSSKFSYCIGNISDPFYAFNKLTLGGDTWPGTSHSYSTPFENRAGHYLIFLEGISSIEKELPIDPSAFHRGAYFIDTGSALSYLPNDVFFSVRDAVSSILDGNFTRVYLTGDFSYMLCYRGDMYEVEFVSLPLVTFHFAEDADIVMDTGNLFYKQEENLFCMSMAPVSDDEPFIIGVMAQQQYNIGFDLSKNRLYLERIDCALVW